MLDRRDFLKSSLVAGVSYSLLNATTGRAEPSADPLSFELVRNVPTRRFTKDECWAQPRAGAIPGGGKDGAPRVVMTLNTVGLDGSDVYKHVYSLQTDDLAGHWTEPVEQMTLAPRYQEVDGEQRPVAMCDAWPGWHAASKTLLATGHDVFYAPNWKIPKERPRHTVYTTYDPATSGWSTWQELEMPAGDKFFNCGAGCTQRFDLPNGEILLPVYFKPFPANSRVTVARCSFDGQTLKYLEHGDELHIDNQTRGLHEPSITKFGDTYYLTLRNDDRGFVTRGSDGLHFEPYRPWTWDDGTDLGNYNTQQHWVTHSDGLFLVYTRRGADNDHVFRHRAPLFMAQVDPERLVVLRDTETILCPNRGARMGNFGVTQVTPHETWVTESEWMQPRGIERYGSDGSVWVVRIQWNRPNQLVTA